MPSGVSVIGRSACVQVTGHECNVLNRGRTRVGTSQAHDPVEAGQLLHRRDELVRRHEILSERVALFENPVNRRQLDDLTIDISLMQQRLNDIEAFRS